MKQTSARQMSLEQLAEALYSLLEVISGVNLTPTGRWNIAANLSNISCNKFETAEWSKQRIYIFGHFKEVALQLDYAQSGTQLQVSQASPAWQSM